MNHDAGGLFFEIEILIIQAYQNLTT